MPFSCSIFVILLLLLFGLILLFPLAGDLILDPASHKVTRGGRPIDLSSKEFSMLEYLMRNRGVVLSRESIREHTWSWDYDGESNIVDVYIRYLRKKIDDGSEEKLIQTVRGTGYMIKGNAE